MVSSGMIATSKRLMDANMFPFSVVLILVQMVISGFLHMILYLIVPSWYPTVSGKDEKFSGNKNAGFGSAPFLKMAQYREERAVCTQVSNCIGKTKMKYFIN